MRLPTLSPLEAAKQRQYATQVLLDDSYHGDGKPTSVPEGSVLIDRHGYAWQSDHVLGWGRPGTDGYRSQLLEPHGPFKVVYVPAPNQNRSAF